MKGKTLSGLRHVLLVIGIGAALFVVTVGLYAAMWWAVNGLWWRIAVWLAWA